MPSSVPTAARHGDREQRDEQRRARAPDARATGDRGRVHRCRTSRSSPPTRSPGGRSRGDQRLPRRIGGREPGRKHRDDNDHRAGSPTRQTHHGRRLRSGAPAAVRQRSSCAVQPDARVEQRIGEVGEQAHGDVDDGDEQHDDLHHHEVARLDGLDRELPDAGPGEDRLDDHRAGQQVADLERRDGDDRARRRCAARGARRRRPATARARGRRGRNPSTARRRRRCAPCGRRSPWTARRARSTAG